MKTINVIKPFTLTGKDLKERSFKVGSHRVEGWIADHWYVKAHTDMVVSQQDGGDNGGDNGGGGNPDEGPTAETIATMNVSEIRTLLGEHPGMVDRVESVEKQRDNERAGVVAAIKEARG